MESWAEKEKDAYIIVLSPIKQKSSYFCHIKTNIFNDANPQHCFSTQSDMAESKLQLLYVYIWTKFDKCALSLNSSGKFKSLVIAGLKQTKQKTGSQIRDYERNF